MQFPELVRQIARQKERAVFTGQVLAIDPGETTGIAEFENLNRVKAYQVSTKDIEQGARQVTPILLNTNWDRVIVEEYRVFSWRAKQHSWSHLHTAQLIGSIKGTCALEDLRVVMQTPQSAKGFCDNVKLKDWGFYIKGEPHARDAIRHGCYYLLFGSKGD